MKTKERRKKPLEKRRIIAGHEAMELGVIQSRRLVGALLNPTPAAPTRLKKAAANHTRRIVA